jgi:hypothetical protein
MVRRDFIKLVSLLSIGITPINFLAKLFYPVKSIKIAQCYGQYPGKIKPVNFKSIQKQSKWLG